MKIISLFLAFCISLNVFAAPRAHEEMETLIDNYHYELSVEWDQKDQKFYSSKTKIFFEEMSQLMAEQGHSKEDVMALIEAKTKDKVLLASIRAKFMLLGGAKSPAEMTNLIQEVSQDFYSKGASWNGEIVAPVVAGLLIAGLVGYLIWYSANYECVEWAEKWVCNTTTSNDNTSFSSSTTSQTVCGWENVCTRREKKN